MFEEKYVGGGKEGVWGWFWGTPFVCRGRRRCSKGVDVGRLGALGAGDAGAKGKPARKGEEKEFRGKGRWKNALPPLSCPLEGY